MCRYGFHIYRDHFACFECRKAFKHSQWEDCDESARKTMPRLRHVPRETGCPECSRPMADMALDFRAPRKDDRDAWQILKVLHANGFTFHNCGCGGIDFKPPRTLRELPAWLEDHRKRSEGEALSERFAARGLP